MVICLAVLILIILLLVLNKKDEEPAAPDPHEGQVYLYDGFDWIWMTPLEGVPVNTITADYFSDSKTDPRFIGKGYTVKRGIDVSEHQYDIDWPMAAQSGIDYAYIRLGRRGTTEGGLFEDEYYYKNMDGALASGLDVGVYFYSQAISVSEAIEEANFVLDRLGSYKISLPIIFDSEKYEGGDARTDNLSSETRTECAVAFCGTIENAGYDAGIYFNRNIGYYGCDLSRLTDFSFWFALPESTFPNFYYKVDMWQYSFVYEVPGIEGEVDMNYMFIPDEPEISADESENA